MAGAGTGRRMASTEAMTVREDDQQAGRAGNS
jgi:hypothetical protein